MTCKFVVCFKLKNVECSLTFEVAEGRHIGKLPVSECILVSRLFLLTGKIEGIIAA